MEREEREKVEGEVRFVREAEGKAPVPAGALVLRLLLARWCRRWLWLWLLLLFDVEAKEIDDR